MICPGRRRHAVLRLWMTLLLLPCSSVAWAEGTDGTPHSLIQHPAIEASQTQRPALSPSQAHSSPYQVVPHTLLKKPTPPSPPLAPAAAISPSGSPQLGASASINQSIPTGITPGSEAQSAADISMERSASSLTSATASPKTEPSRLPSPLQRLFRENPAFIKLLQVPPPSATPPPVSSINKATLTWIANKESDLAGYKIYVGTASGTYNFPGSPFTVQKITTYTVTNLQQRTTYFFAISAFDLAGNESPLSNEASKSIF
jgi:hypothetical protein